MFSAHFRVRGDAALRFEIAFEEAVQQMKTILDDAAAQERATHAYQNRTGDLEASTYASDVITIGDAHEVQLGARTEYAEYVNARGLMTIGDRAAQAEVDIRAVFEALTKKI